MSKKHIYIHHPARLLVTAFIPILAVAFFHFVFYERIFWGVFIGNINLSGQTALEAKKLLSVSLQPPPSINLEKDNLNFAINTGEINLNYDLGKSVDDALKQGRNKNLVDNIFLPTTFIFKKQT